MRRVPRRKATGSRPTSQGCTLQQPVVGNLTAHAHFGFPKRLLQPKARRGGTNPVIDAGGPIHPPPGSEQDGMFEEGTSSFRSTEARPSNSEAGRWTSIDCFTGSDS